MPYFKFPPTKTLMEEKIQQLSQKYPTAASVSRYILPDPHDIGSYVHPMGLFQKPIQSGISKSIKLIKSTQKPAWNMTKEEFWGQGIRAKAGVMTKEGKFITGWDHGDAYNRAIEAGYAIEDKLGQVAGWKVGAEVFLDKDIMKAGDDLHRAVIERAKQQGKEIFKHVLDEYGLK